MMFQAVLSNRDHPEYGVATIPFPIPHDQYAHCMDLLEALEIGDAVRADCKVEKIDGFYTVLKRTEMLTVNVEELNYLAKRLDGFDTGEAEQFQAMAHKLELFELKDLINLSFCCQQVTVITDFSDLDAVGRDHYMNLHGGSARVDELEALDGEETARLLIGNGSGTITPYGVVYDNGMQMKLLYDGQFFPCYYYEPNPITVAVTAKSDPEDTEHMLGINGIKLWRYANGTDTSRVMHKDFVSPVKSIGHGITCTADLQTPEEVFRVMLELSQDVGHRLRVHELMACGVQVSVRANDLYGSQYQCKLPFRTQLPNEIAGAGFHLFMERYRWGKPIRAVTIRGIDLVSQKEAEQLSMFVDHQKRDRRIRLEDAVEDIRKRFGKRAISYAVLMDDLKIPDDGRRLVTMPGLMYQ